MRPVGSAHDLGLALFQSTHPSGVRRVTATAGRWTSIYFNPRTPVGCDGSACSPSRPIAYFNPRTPVGCDPATPMMPSRRSNFNPRTPVGCDSRFFGDTRKTYGNFNPRTPVGCDVAISFTNLRLRISIHAPQWGATGQFFLFQLFKRFQSTHPSGVRHGVCTNGSKREPISIHAPQWGATIWDCDTPEFGYHFNPRTPVGCDHAGRIHRHRMNRFQSTHPSGVRRSSGSRRRVRQMNFNPRTPVGCDSPSSA